MITINPRRSLRRLLVEHAACSSGTNWARMYRTASAAWKACYSPSWMLWALEESGYAAWGTGKKQLRLFACRCVKETPLPDSGVVWDFLTHDYSKRAVWVAESYANGLVGEADLVEAKRNATYIANQSSLLGERERAVWAASKTAIKEAVYAAYDVSHNCIIAAGGLSTLSVEHDNEAGKATAAFHADLLREMVGNPFSVRRSKP